VKRVFGEVCEDLGYSRTCCVLVLFIPSKVHFSIVVVFFNELNNKIGIESKCEKSQ